VIDRIETTMSSQTLTYTCSCGFSSATATAFHQHLQSGRKAGEWW
jgi:hypothetical protein